jgi:hypothetical protein
MSHYFYNFPTVAYRLPVAPTNGIGSAFRSNRTIGLTDISTRFIIKQIVGDPNLIYYDYVVRDGERPDIIAEKYYGDSRLDWVLMFFNQIHDPYFEWVKNTLEFENYIRQKYGSIADAQAEVNRYEQKIYSQSTYTNDFGETIVVPAKYVTVDASTYATLSPTDRREIDQYTHENNLNEAKRNIKILDEEFVPELLKTYREYFEE